ncbi:Alaserpin [Eumeta japonica]|uniref:Alaserpin n=1 Tax=Eumeta variegata TaxID=151549 RepID=A0A4C1VYR0_EUMVA|nr:Alaserpin [Eumeta japonica]
MVELSINNGVACLQAVRPTPADDKHSSIKTIITLFTLFALATANELEDYQKQFRDGSVQFSSKMFSEVVQSNPDKSVVLSAFSVLPPLAQLSLASVGESHDELLHAMGLQNDNVTRAVFPVVIQQLQSAKGVELKLASKVYVAQGFQIQEQFEADTRRLLDSEIQNINFVKNTEAASEINQWVENKTNHRIKDLMKPESLDGDTRAVFVNAIYFKGSWKSKFNKDATTDRDFHVSAANTIKIPTMFKNGEFKYGTSDELNAQLLEIPYEGDEASFLIVLPNDIEGLPALERKLKENPALLTEASQQILGVTKIFDLRTARLENLIKTEEPLYVSEAIQKAFIEVNEEGAEAAAANYIVLQNRSGGPELTFVADHPFVFAIRHSQLDLFTGAVTFARPRAASEPADCGTSPCC